MLANSTVQLLEVLLVLGLMVYQALKGGFGSTLVTSLEYGNSYSRRFQNSSVLTGSSLKIVGMIIALAVLGILGGLAFFNASQQKGINNSIGVAIIILPIALLLWMVSVAVHHR